MLRRRTAPTMLLAAGLLTACSGSTGTAGSTLAPSPRQPSDPTATRPEQTTPATAPATTPASAHPRSPGTRPAPPPIAWTGCGGPARCGVLEVPLDYADPGGPTIGLDVIHIPTTSRNPAGPLMVNPGGPGGSAVDFARSVAPRFTADFDVYAFDPRGVSGTHALRCDADAEASFRRVDSMPDSPAEQQQLDAAARAIADACADTSGPLLAHMTTTDAAHDLDQLRVAIGAEQISWLGFSYGTLLGLRYAEQFPTRVRAMAIDGVVDPERTLEELLTDQARLTMAAFTRGVERCRADSRCAAVDPTRRLADLTAKVEVSPLDVDGSQVGPSEVVLAVVAAGYVPARMDRLVAALEDTNDLSTGRTLLALAQEYTSAASFGTYLGVECTDGPRPASPTEFHAMAARMEAAVPGMGAHVANELLACAFWAAPAGPSPTPVRAVGTPPILVIGTTGDPATPYSYAVAVADTLDRATLLTHEGEGHTATFASACVASHVDRYLTSLLLPPDGTRCA